MAEENRDSLKSGPARPKGGTGPGRFGSLKLELVVMTTIFVLILSASTGAAVGWIYNRALGAGQVEAALAFARGAAISLSLSSDWRNFPWPTLEGTAGAAGYQLAVVAENRGRAVHRSIEAQDRDETVLRYALITGEAQANFDGRRFSVAAPVIRHGGVVGAVCFVGEAGRLKGAQRTARQWLAGALGINLMVMALFLVFFLNQRLVTPLKTLAGDLEALAADRFEPHQRPATSWEISELFRAFDQAALELMGSRRQLEEQLKTISETQDHLVASEKMATVGRLASGLAHELGNPIGALTGFVHLLRRENLPAESRQKILDQSAEELARMDGSIKDLLHFSRPTVRVPEPVDAAEVIEAALNLVRPQKWAEGIDFLVETEVGCPPVMAQRNGLMQIFLNLLTNAGHALEGREGEKKISISIQKPGLDRQVRLRVVDNGAGVAPEDAPHLFEPYFTRKEPGQGTGLGLAISLSIVNEFGGRLDYSPSPAGGAIFTISLPAADL